MLVGTIPAESGVQVDTVTVVDGVVIVVVRPTRAAVPCPACGQLARRVHSHYQRALTDLPWQGVAVRLALHARRFRCDEPTCPQRVFAERFPGLVAPGARRSVRLSTCICRSASCSVARPGRAWSPTWASASARTPCCA